MRLLLIIILVLGAAMVAAQQPDPGIAIPPVAADLIDDLDETPLGDVWPTLSDGRTGDLDALIEKGEIRILTTFTLGSYFIDRGRQQGVVYELSLELEKYAREKLGAKAKTLKVTIIPVRRDQLLPFLIAGHGDVAFANLTVTPERRKIVDFSKPFTNKVRELLVTGPGAPEIRDITDLAGKEIVVPLASSYYESIEELNKRFESEDLEPVKVTPSDPRLEIEDILEMMNVGLIPISVADEYRADFWSKVFGDVTVRDDVVLRDKAAIALAMRKGSPLLKDLLDSFAHEYRVGTLLTNILIRKYGVNTGWAKSTLAREPSRHLEQLTGLFKTYGSRYEFDWLLLASFAFQESGLDHSVRSHVGAIGVMQVMPATAADRAVNIPNIEILENNIHAGTKYLSVLRGHYFSDEDMDPTERMLFTMAGYNAGPNRINRLRRLAAARGLDPNVWFNNVELVVAAKVGREPVVYVANIYRYYIAYKRALETRERRELLQTVQ
jgi:membrane-bound lytic murein transglycosylase MltF